MSMELMVKAMKIKVGNPLRKLVLLKLADNASDLGECWPSHQHIADQCEISKRSVIGHIKALSDMGLLRVENRVKNNEKQSNIYYLTLDKKSSAGDSPPSATDAQGGAGDSLPSSAGDAHRTSHLSEPVNEPSLSSDDDEKPTQQKSKYSPKFDQWWDLYLKKTGKGAAWKAWKRDKLDERADELIGKLEMINAMDYGFRQREYIPLPATYLNESRYDDEIVPRTLGGNHETSSNRKLSAHERVRQANDRAREQRAAQG